MISDYSDDDPGAADLSPAPDIADVADVSIATSVPSEAVATAQSARRLWRVVLALYLATAAVVTANRISGRASNNFLIFRTATATLLAHQDLYAPHPGQHYDLYKYSPTFALLFLPFAVIPYGAALAAWNLLNTVALCAAFRRLLAPRQAAIVLAFALPAFAVATQSAQSNALVAALIIAAFLAFERERPLPAAAATLGGASAKLFPVAALTFAVFHPRRWRAAIVAATVGAAAFFLPLLVISPAELRIQYTSWYRVAQVDALDRGSSVMQLAHELLGVDWPNWPLQLAGTALFVLPVLLRRDRWREPAFRHLMLASLLVYVVLFNHQAERASFVIASAGIGLWYVVSERRRTAWRTALAIGAAMGMHSVLCLPAWIAIQRELYASARDPA